MPILLEPGNPSDFDDKELQVLVDQLQTPAGTVTVRIHRRPERGYGVSLFEVLHVYLEVAGAAGTVWSSGEIVHKVISFMKSRWQKEKARNPRELTRPRSVNFYDEFGRLLARYNIDEPEGDAVEVKDLKESERRVPPGNCEERPRGLEG